MEGKAQVDDILKMIFPPRAMTYENRDYVQNISTEDPLKEDITMLALKLQQKLKERQARVKGICDVRYEIYDEAFNELIRQVAINCPERGLLLMKVRDEMKITTAAYKALYESSVVFGVRKQVQAEAGVNSMENQIKELERNKKILENYKIE
jgi:dynein light intermediate chain